LEHHGKVAKGGRRNDSVDVVKGCYIRECHTTRSEERSGLSETSRGSHTEKGSIVELKSAIAMRERAKAAREAGTWRVEVNRL
jgi:hypothetical protein